MPKLEPATKKPKKLTKDTLPARLQYVVDQFHGKWGDDENKAGELVANLANYQWMDDTDNLIMDAVDGILCQRFRQADSEHFMLYKTVLVAHHDITKPVPKKK
jgi:hypothetical protein